MAVKRLVIVWLLLSGNGFAQKTDMVFLYNAVRTLGWKPIPTYMLGSKGPTNVYLAQALSLGGMAIVISTGTDDSYRVSQNFSVLNHVEVTDQQIEDVIRETLIHSLHIEDYLGFLLASEDCLGYLLIERDNMVHRYDYLWVNNQLEVVDVEHFDLLSYQRDTLLATLQEIHSQRFTKNDELIFYEELAKPKRLPRTFRKLKQRFFNPDYYERQVLQILNDTINGLNKIVEQQKDIIANSIDYRSSISLISQAVGLANTSLTEALQAVRGPSSSKQLTKVIDAHLQGIIVIGEHNAQRLLSTLLSGINKVMASQTQSHYGYNQLLLLSRKDYIQELFKRAEQIIPIERLAFNFQKILDNHQHFYQQRHQYRGKILETIQQIDELLSSLAGSQLLDAIDDLNEARLVSAEFSVGK